MNRNKLYQEFKDEISFIEDELNKKDVTDEDLSPSETITVSALERQKAQMEGQKIKFEQGLKNLLEKMNQLEAQISRMKAT